ncbi:MAG: hypothetical protein J5I94_29140 [Phaeodactylibacter sp.]|nr:hypothetical protein [Phaeodactylibacter sp.]
MKTTPRPASLFLISFLFLAFPSTAVGQYWYWGAEFGYVLAAKKEGFAGRIYRGDDGDDVRLSFGLEGGKFNSKPTERVLPYYSVKAGVDFRILQNNVTYGIHPFIGLDFELLKTTRILKKTRVSLFPRIGARFANIIFVTISADNLKEPGNEARFFDLNINAFRVTIGFNYFGSDGYGEGSVFK